MKRRAAYLIGLFLALGVASARADDAVSMLDESCRVSPTAQCLLAYAHARATQPKVKDVVALRYIATIEERVGDTVAAVRTLERIMDIRAESFTRQDMSNLMRLAGRDAALPLVTKLDANFRQKYGESQSASSRPLLIATANLSAFHVMVGNIPAARDLLEQEGRDDNFRAAVAGAIFDNLPATARNHAFRLHLASVMGKSERPSPAAVLAYLELGEIDPAIALVMKDPALILNARRGIVEKGMATQAVTLIKATPDPQARENEYQGLAKDFLENDNKAGAGRVLVEAFADYDLSGRVNAAQKVRYRSVKEAWRLSSLAALVGQMKKVGVADTAVPSLQAAYGEALATEDPTIRFLLIAPIAIALRELSDTNEFLEQARNLARSNPQVLAWDCESLILGAQLGLVDETLTVARSEDGRTFCGSTPMSLEMLVVASLSSSGYADEAEATLFSLSDKSLAPQMLCGGVASFYTVHLSEGRADRAVAVLQRAPQCKFPFGMAGLLLFSQIDTTVKGMVTDSRFEDALRIIRAVPSEFRARYLNVVADGYAAAERPTEALQLLEEARSSVPGECRKVGDLLSIALRAASLSSSTAERFLKDALAIVANSKNASCAQTMTFASAALVASRIAEQ